MYKAARFESIRELKKKVRSHYANDESGDPADVSLVDSLEAIRARMDWTSSNLDFATDPLLIDGYVYELKSLHVKYDYLLRQCKERGLTADFY